MKIEAKDKNAEIWIYDDIGEDFFGGLSANQFVKDLNALGDVEHIDLRLNSAGGSVMDGVGIYNALDKHPASVDVHIDGWALSIASVIAMAGDRVIMPENGLFMIHDPIGGVHGNSASMRSMADVMDKVKTTLINTYQKKVSLSETELNDMMSSETWMEAKEALDYGFVDELSAEVEMAACANDKLGKLFKHPPKDYGKILDAGKRPRKESFAKKRAHILLSLKERQL